MFNIASLDKLVHELSRLPSIGHRTAQRLAYALLRSPDISTGLSQALMAVQKQVRLCQKCFSYTESETYCAICSDVHRWNHILCVVEEPLDILRIESSRAFRGYYHVLHGAISPLDGITPEKLKIAELVRRVQRNTTVVTKITDNTNVEAPRDPEDIAEVVLALGTDLKGDTTALYLAQILAETTVKVTRIAHGVPMGTNIDYIDHRTLGRALENRVQMGAPGHW